MNQNGRTPTSATRMAMMKIMINSGIPIGPIMVDVVWCLVLRKKVVAVAA